MFQGVRSASWLSAVRVAVILAFLSICEVKVNSLSSTAAPSTVPLVVKVGGPKDEKAKFKNDTQLKKIFHNGNENINEDLHSELNVLLTELRQIADKIETIRKEHSQLAHGVNEISDAVKDMNERSEHIKKKVRKMSKAINKTTHHNKLKSSLKNLQKDHKRILEAMLNSTFFSHLHRNNHTSTHRNHNGTKHSKHNKHCNNNGSHHCNTTNVPKKREEEYEDDGDNNIPTVTSSVATTTRLLQTVSPAPFVSKKVEQTPVSPTEKDNTIIPEPVIEPQGKLEEDVEDSPKKFPPLPEDCTEVIQMGNMTSGVYRIKPKGINEPLKVWCDHTTQGGGWTMLVARLQTEPQQDFNLNWEDYKKGFGNPASEYWIGNEALYAMTNNRRNELRLNITDWEDDEAWAEWKEFSITSEEKGYALTIGRYVSSSTAGDALKWHNGMKFSTPDRDNDALMGGHCALKNNGGWWYRGYRGCYQAHPTGMYQKNPSVVPKKADKRNFDLGPVLAWQNWRGESFFPKTLFLMFRPVLP